MVAGVGGEAERRLGSGSVEGFDYVEKQGHGHGWAEDSNKWD
jgi:hypothetical protein